MPSLKIWWYRERAIFFHKSEAPDNVSHGAANEERGAAGRTCTGSIRGFWCSYGPNQDTSRTNRAPRRQKWHSFVMDRHGNRIMAQTKFKGDHTRTPHNAFRAAVAATLERCVIPFRAASKGDTQAKGMLGNLLGPIERARDSAKTTGERSPRRKGRLMESSPVLLSM